ncbi:DUF2591 domain-containing protein [Xenorhabdus sp. XENO-1]|uniref:phage protein NinX family protein n=1 Tax=Xenorhabdus bovienii TaxID=40576 RepID=UPI0020CA2C2A|nr:phage protein NinX family protein [Xenorhabdus bovienii]MCP9269693.1 DUF2591 domain-containing protein [Xenorhabdus bovienii subsp. africana]
MKIKTSELTGRALDWAVARADGRGVKINELGYVFVKDRRSIGVYSPSTNWRECGQLIEEYLDDVTYVGRKDNHWVASCKAVTVDDFSIWKVQEGQTPQIAICRAVVAAQLGDEVEIPDELMEAE